MKLNDIGLLAIVFLAGLLIGVVGTLGAYSSVASRQAEAGRQEAEEAAKRLEDERDQLQAQINDYVAAEKDKAQAAAAGVAAEPPARPAEPKGPAVASAPRQDTGSSGKREGVPAPREDKKSSAKAAPDPAGGFGPPREYPNK
jgi:hypothetical protein